MSYAPTGIERVGSSLWTTYNYFLGGNIIEVDVDSGAILRVLPFPRGRMPLGMDYDGQDLWIVNARMSDTDSLVRVSTQDGRILASIPTPGPEAAGVAWDGKSLWHTDQSTDLLYELEPTSGAVLSQFELPIGTAHGIAYDPQDRTFWITDDDERIEQIIAPSGRTHLLEFHASTDEGVVVHWRPTLASVQREFVLERSDAAGGSYAAVARLDGAGESFSACDPSPIPGNIYYYRLQAIGPAGTRILGPLSVAYRYAYPPIRTPLSVEDLRAVWVADGIRMEWRLGDVARIGIVSIHVERAPESGGPFIRLTAAPLQPESRMLFEDASVPPGSTPWYRLVLGSLSGVTTIAGPVRASLPGSRSLRLDPPIVSDRGVEFRYDAGAKATRVRLAIYDGRGRCVRVLEDAVHGPGEQRVTWNAMDQAGRAAARGVYFAELKAGGQAMSRRLAWIHR
jgi:hypothetical protein